MRLSDKLREECYHLNHIIWLVERRSNYAFNEEWRERLEDWAKYCTMRNTYYYKIKQEYEEFTKDFQNNILCYKCGLKDEFGIHAPYADLYLIQADTYKVPLGFLKGLDPDWDVLARSCLEDYLEDSRRALKVRWDIKREKARFHYDRRWELAEEMMRLEKAFREASEEILGRR